MSECKSRAIFPLSLVERGRAVVTEFAMAKRGSAFPLRIDIFLGPAQVMGLIFLLLK